MTDLFVKSFRKIIEVYSWILLIIFIILGGVIGYQVGNIISYEEEVCFMAAVLGVVIGGLLGFISETLVFAPMIILFELNDKVSKIDEKLSGIENKDKTN